MKKTLRFAQRKKTDDESVPRRKFEYGGLLEIDQSGEPWELRAGLSYCGRGQRGFSEMLLVVSSICIPLNKSL